MPFATVRIAYINQPDKNPKFGSIKTDHGYVSVPAAQLGLFQQGRTYEIEYTVTDKGYKNFKRIVPSPSSAQAGAGGAAAANDDTARAIFVTGVVGRAMGSGKFDIDKITSLALEAHRAWEALAEIDNVPEMDDEIPF